MREIEMSMDSLDSKEVLYNTENPNMEEIRKLLQDFERAERLLDTLGNHASVPCCHTNSINANKYSSVVHLPTFVKRNEKVPTLTNNIDRILMRCSS